jgi:DNA topoisomerase-1
MESKLDLVAAGKLNWKVVLAEFFENLVEAINNNKEFAPQASQTCPDCGSPMVTRRNRWGKLFLGCSNYPNCKCIINYK